MGRVILVLAALVSFGVGVMALANIRSDIQIIIALVGILGGFILGAQAFILDKLDKLTPRA